MIRFEPRSDCNYKYDYAKILAQIGDKPDKHGLGIYRSLILDDLFFVVCFVMGIEKANHPFVVDCCRLVETGPKTHTLDVWSRGHFKSSVITIAETLQFHLKYPNKCTGIFAYARPAAKAFLRAIKCLCEESEILKAAFPDIIYQNPQRDSAKWSEDDGLTFRGANPARKESTIEAWGLIEGMPTGRHFDRLIFDDIETDDIKDSPDQMDKVFSKFEMAWNLGTMSEEDVIRVIGTYYSHNGPISRIQSIQGTNGRPLYHLRKVPGSKGGDPNGDPLFMPKAQWELMKTSRHFASQMLCDPTPINERRLNPQYFRPIEQDFIPADVMKFMVIDPAGDSGSQDGKDCWAIGVFGVQPQGDEVGASNVYLLDADISKHSVTSAIESAVRMYLRNGVIQKVGVEKMGQSSAEIHLANALKARGRQISVENGTLVVLKSGKVKKATRIENNLAWPLDNGKLYYSTAVHQSVVDRIKMEMDKFPVWHDDGLDIMSYLYDMIKDYNFATKPANKKMRYNLRGIA